METILGIVIVALGGWAFLDPKSCLDMKVKWAKMFGVKMVPSKKTYQMYKWVGVAAVLVGLYIIFT